MEITGIAIESVPPCGKLLIRPELSPTEGISSLANCLQIARIWPSPDQVHFTLSAHAPSLAEKRIIEAGFNCQRFRAGSTRYDELLQLQQSLAEDAPVAVILDGKRLANSNWASSSLWPHRVVCLQEPAIAQCPKFCIQTPGEKEEKAKKIVANARRIAVVVHGSDKRSLTIDIFKALDRLTTNSFSVDVCIDPDNIHRERLRDLASTNRHSVRLHGRLANLNSMVSRFDLGIVDFGSGCLHLAYHGVPMLAVDSDGSPGPLRQSMLRTDSVEVANSQGVAALVPAIQALARDRDRRRQLSSAGSQLVDGRGAERIVDLLNRESSPLRIAS